MVGGGRASRRCGAVAVQCGSGVTPNIHCHRPVLPSSCQECKHLFPLVSLPLVSVMEGGGQIESSRPNPSIRPCP
ncbi:hypothetical protein J6590_024461 [Homalodisca vitripennis]|nr:hypothetical protein J6590_024461 [Homalodisca vitripennis]